ncbi:hypothetical protein F0562_010737 [Nyssa sinensis]|uniref:Uncharacterized protein n=1 Tax=Nyssa sinensis TaxID=561372 RepID=A0A5J5A287_9ASTE|nr:hypothetical protein F0562_010737 [Nyssa sinensis]
MEVGMALNRVVSTVVVLRITACRVFDTERLVKFRTPPSLLLTSSDGFGIGNGRWDDRQWRGVRGAVDQMMAGTVDLSFSSSTNLDIFKLDCQPDDRNLPVVGLTLSFEGFYAYWYTALFLKFVRGLWNIFYGS